MNISACDQCGRSDDHPKVHSFGGGTHHHDCLSAAARAELVAASPQALSIVEAAESGVRGDDLRTHILTVHTEA